MAWRKLCKRWQMDNGVSLRKLKEKTLKLGIQTAGKPAVKDPWVWTPSHFYLPPKVLFCLSPSYPQVWLMDMVREFCTWNWIPKCVGA